MMTRCVLLILALVADVLCGADWPQYRGPERNDVSAETGLLREWPAGGPKLAWTYTNAGIGYSAFAVVGKHLYTIGGRGESEYLIALNLATIKDGAPAEAWAAAVGRTFDWQGNKWSAGPSSTPTVDGELIYALGGMGDLVCVEAASGKERWRKNLPKELDAQVNPIGGGPKGLGWGFTWSPLVDGERLICVPGGPKGTLAALDKRSGNVLWRSAELTDQAAYTSPVAAEIGGVRQYVVLTNQGLAGIAAADGKVLWRFARKYGTEVVNSPTVRGALVYATVGAGQGSDLIRVSQSNGTFTTESVYANKNMANHHGNTVLVGEHVFGFSEGKGWICQKFETGEIVWAERMKMRAGSMTYADGRFYLYGEDDGTTVLIDASASGWKESGRFKIPQQSKLRKPSGKIWTPPVVAHGQLFLRDQDLLFCYSVEANR